METTPEEAMARLIEVQGVLKTKVEASVLATNHLIAEFRNLNREFEGLLVKTLNSR